MSLVQWVRIECPHSLVFVDPSFIFLDPGFISPLQVAVLWDQNGSIIFVVDLGFHSCIPFMDPYLSNWNPCPPIILIFGWLCSILYQRQGDH